MRRFADLAAYLALLSITTDAIHLKSPRSTAPAVVSVDTKRSVIQDPVKRDLQRLLKRQSGKTVPIDLLNQQTLYFANVSIGTPPQNIALHIDTGSSDLWVNTPTSRICRSLFDYCVSGTYDPSASSTYNLVNDDFDISYVDGSGSSGNYVTDVVRIGNVSLPNMQFGVGLRSTNINGILGIGYVANEAIRSIGGATYPNMPQLMVDGGLINSNAYSLWLNDLDSSTGEILFGGVNTEKYNGNLETLPILTSARRGAAEFLIALTGIGFNVDGAQSTIITDSVPTAVLLDSGASLTYITNDMAETIYDTVGAQYSPRDGVAICACALATNNSFLTFNFSGPVIEVPFNELVIDPGTNYDGSVPTLANGEDACIFGIMPAGNNPNILGDTFLRSAYVVYDLENDQISLAQTNFNASQDNIMEIGTGPDAVPDAEGVENPVTIQATATGGARIGFPGGTATATGADATQTGAASATEISNGLMAILGSGIGAAALLAL